MTKELRAKIAALRANAPELNAATDEASTIVERVDRLLGEELSIGVSAESSAFDTDGTTDDEGNPIAKAAHLAYGRVGGRYRVHVMELTGTLDGAGYWDRTIDEELTPWSSCPREVKLKSFKMLPDLLGKIADKAGAMAKESRETSKTVNEVMDAFGDNEDTGADSNSSHRTLEPLGSEGMRLAHALFANSWYSPDAENFPVLHTVRAGEKGSGREHSANLVTIKSTETIDITFVESKVRGTWTDGDASSVVILTDETAQWISDALASTLKMREETEMNRAETQVDD